MQRTAGRQQEDATHPVVTLDADQTRENAVAEDHFTTFDEPRPRPGTSVGPEYPDKDPVPTWDEVAHTYGRKIYSIAYRLTGDPDEAKDLTQDVFVRVYRNLDKYEPGTFEGWLYRVTKNLFLDKVRKRKRAIIEPLPDEEWKQTPEPAPGPQDRLEQGLLRGDIEVALRSLPPDFRTAVVLCDVQGLSYEEISEATGWPLGTVRSRIHRGRKQLRDRLLDGGSDDA